MKNPEYYRLIKAGRFVGFKRVVTEYLPAGHSAWQFDRLEHDPEETQRLSRPAAGIETMKRQKFAGQTQKVKVSTEAEEDESRDN